MILFEKTNISTCVHVLLLKLTSFGAKYKTSISFKQTNELTTTCKTHLTAIKSAWKPLDDLLLTRTLFANLFACTETYTSKCNQDIC
jgi:Na+-translocating ferredoxin:NAD+ oxidoreductase RnfD subunit